MVCPATIAVLFALMVPKQWEKKKMFSLKHESRWWHRLPMIAVMVFFLAT
jgi:hypothetical protein